MCTYIIFSEHRYVALTASVKVRIGSPKRVRLNKFVRTKSHTGNKFSKIYTGWIVVVHLYCGFSLWRQMPPQQSAKFSTAFFGQFRTSLRKDSVANYASIWTLFSLFVRRPGVFCNALNIVQFRR